MNAMPQRLAGLAVETFAAPPSLDEAAILCLSAARAERLPFPHLRLHELLPPQVRAALAALPGAAPAPPTLGEPVGATQTARRLRGRGPEATPVTRALAQTFSSEPVLQLIAARSGVDLAGARLVIRRLQETDGYACAPQTSEGHARYRIWVGLSPSHQSDLGPDLYDQNGEWAGQAAWGPGHGLGFAPGEDTWHGFEPRLIRRVRASLVIDYVEPTVRLATSQP